MLSRGNTLHFINRVDTGNCGDLLCCPLTHYFDYFKKYTLLRHDIRYIEFDSIAPTDVVILGGGGLFDYSESCNRAINKLLDTGATVIAWAPGFNTHSEFDGTFSTKIEFEKFELLTVRDYENKYNFNYLPDVTCKLAGLSQNYTIKRKYGVARHKDYPIKGLEMYDEITNSSGEDDILRFLGETEIVISNSYHLIYWSILMGKKTICVSPFSSRFYGYKYKPVFCTLNQKGISECAEKAENYNALEECIEENDKFFEQVKEIIENKLSPTAESALSMDYITDTAVWKGYARDKEIRSGDAFSSNLFIDTGEGFMEEKKRISINSVIGEEISSVRFDISDYPYVKGLRFDPVEGHFCEVEIISAVSGCGEIEPIPDVCVRHGSKAIFLNTDPQYYIYSECQTFVEIKFKLRLLTAFESEQAICEYYRDKENYRKQKDAEAKRQSAKIDEQNVVINDQILKLNEQDLKLNNQNSEIEGLKVKLNELTLDIESLNAKLKEQNDVINDQSQKLKDCGSEIDSLNMRLNTQDAVVEDRNARLSEQNLKISEMDTLIEDQKEIIEKQSNRINEQLSTIGNQIASLKEDSIRIKQLNETLQSVQNQDEHLKAEIESLYHSHSWRITAPLRGISSSMKKLLKGKK